MCLEIREQIRAEYHLSRKYGTLNVSELYWLRRPVRRIALLSLAILLRRKVGQYIDYEFDRI
jgi:hypothetical protein